MQCGLSKRIPKAARSCTCRLLTVIILDPTRGRKTTKLAYMYVADLRSRSPGITEQRRQTPKLERDNKKQSRRLSH